MSTKYSDIDSPAIKTFAPTTKRFWDCDFGTYLDDPCNWCSFRNNAKSDSSTAMASRVADLEDDDNEALLGASRPSYDFHEESAFEYVFCFGGPPTACDEEPSSEEDIDVKEITTGQSSSTAPNTVLPQSSDTPSKAAAYVKRRRKSCFGIDALSIVSEEPSTMTAIHNAEQGQQLTKELNKTFQLIGLDAEDEINGDYNDINNERVKSVGES
uniref:Uncharacterized protein n=1 Tax=Leptocylindrus danicus TaxID=163516 RepID=A0A7S2K921_9STRA